MENKFDEISSRAGKCRGSLCKSTPRPGLEHSLQQDPGAATERKQDPCPTTASRLHGFFFFPSFLSALANEQAGTSFKFVVATCCQPPTPRLRRKGSQYGRQFVSRCSMLLLWITRTERAVSCVINFLFCYCLFLLIPSYWKLCFINGFESESGSQLYGPARLHGPSAVSGQLAFFNAHCISTVTGTCPPTRREVKRMQVTAYNLETCRMGTAALPGITLLLHQSRSSAVE